MSFIIPQVIERSNQGSVVGYDIYSRLLKDRIIFVGGYEGEITTDSANVLICPNLDAANILFNVLKTTSGQGMTIGPILLGAAAPVHILTPSSTVRRIINMTALGAAKAAARAVGVAAANARAAAHAALAVTLHGLSAAGAVSTAEAALRAHGRMSAAPLMSAGGAEPHRVRTSTLVYCLTRPEGLPKHPLLPLIATNYVLEVRRVPPRGAPLRWPELLSWAAPHAGRWISAPWLAVLTEMEAPAPS